MKGPRDLKRYVAKHRRMLKAWRWDDLFVSECERCRKWRKQNRRPRDGYGIRGYPQGEV